jgi:predicted methyltransferase
LLQSLGVRVSVTRCALRVPRYTRRIPNFQRIARVAWPVAFCAFFLFLLASPSQASEDHPKLFDPRRAPVLDRPEREAWQKPEQVVKALGLRPGQRVADVGTGSGYFLPWLSRAVGSEGVVYGVDVQPEMLDWAERKVREARLPNVRLVRSTDTDTKIPPRSADVVLMINTYHEVGDPAELMKHLRSVLKPGGLLAIVDWKPEPTPLGPPLSHRVDPDHVRRTVEAAGFRPEREETFLPYQYFLLFR